MRVEVAGEHGSRFLDWATERPDIPARRGEILVARDAEMVAAWDEHGYEIPGSNEGPFSILYEPCSARTFAAIAQQDPYGRDQEYRFEPYETVIVGNDLTLTTVVTADRDGMYSREVIDAVVSVLAG